MIANSPICADGFAACMARIGFFESHPTLAVALSGGADSMALALLANDWAKARGGNIIALTIDHALRKASASEAQQVKNWCAKHSIEHHTLRWQHDGVTTAIQSTARDARYELLLGWCKQNHVLHLLTGHHSGDQSETLFLRIARGSGLDGLSAMSAQTTRHGIRHVRPLLGVTKQQLTDFLTARNEQWIEDPSNQNTDFTRVNIRQQLQGTDASYATEAVGNFRNALENKLAEQLTHCVMLSPMGYAKISRAEFSAMPNELRSRGLKAIIHTLTGDDYAVRSEKLERLHATLFDKKQTLAGFIFEPLENSLLIYREEKTIAPPIELSANMPTLWDNRFLVSFIQPSSKFNTLSLRKLGSDGLKQLSELPKHLPPARILRTLPSLWSLEECVCVPHIEAMRLEKNTNGFHAFARFMPAKPLAGAAFFVMNNPSSSVESLRA